MYPGYCTVLASSTSSPDLRTRGFGSRGDNYDTKDAGLRKDGVVGVGVEGGGGREGRDGVDDSRICLSVHNTAAAAAAVCMH